MSIILSLALVVALMSLTGCGGGNSSTPTGPTSATVAAIAPSLGAEINSSFIAAMGAGVPMASRDIGRPQSFLVMLFESLVSLPVYAQTGFVGNCSRGGNVRIQYLGAAPQGGRVTLVNTAVTYASCGHSLNGRDITANGTLTANGTWTASAPTSPVRLSGDLTVNEIGIVPIDGSTGALFNGSIGGITVGTPDTPPPTPTPTPTPPPSSLCPSSPCTLSTPGTYTFTVPAQATTLMVQTWGGGGGAGGGCVNTQGGTNSTGGAGGGGGGYASGTLSVSAGQAFTVAVGTPGNSGETTTAGGASSFGTSFTANGGGGGGANKKGPGCPQAAPGGSGGTASGGTTVSGGKGGAGTFNGPGGNGGTAGGPGGGAGGTGGAAGKDGGNGSLPGGGAGGDGGDKNTGRAANGQVVIAWQ